MRPEWIDRAAPWAAPVGRVAMISVHTSPLATPGTGDAGGMNVAIDNTARRLAEQGVLVEAFTRRTDPGQSPTVEVAAGYLVHHITAGPPAPLPKSQIPLHLGTFSEELLRREAARPAPGFDIIHSHYWLSGLAGWDAARAWGVPLVHSMHTIARVKNQSLALGDQPEPADRLLGEARVAADSDALIANTSVEAAQLQDLLGVPGGRIRVVPPGVDLDLFAPGSRRAARARLGVRPGGRLLLFAGRLQPLKGPDVAVAAVAELLRRRPELAGDVELVVLGDASGAVGTEPSALRGLASKLGIADRVRFPGAVDQSALADWYRAADLTLVPSHSESFGLVAVESSAVGTPVLAADVGGLPTAVADGLSGALVPGHDPALWAERIGQLLGQPDRLAALSRGAVRHARQFGWERTAAGTLAVYAGVLAKRPVALAAAAG